jgi:hypothetical protein
MSRTILVPLLFALFWHGASANPATTTTTPASSTTGVAPAFPTMSATDGGGVAQGGVGSQDNGSTAGASGDSQSAFNLGKGGVVGISVAIGVVVIAISECPVSSTSQHSVLTKTQSSYGPSGT